MATINTVYELCSFFYKYLKDNNTFVPKLSIPIPISITIPYNTSEKKETDKTIKDLEYFQMDKLLSWMELFFQKDITIKEEELQDEKIKEQYEKHRAYKQELYNIYMTIKSDYKQYKKWSEYNKKLWIPLMNKSTHDLSRKIISDIDLFNEGLKMFTLFERI